MNSSVTRVFKGGKMNAKVLTNNPYWKRANGLFYVVEQKSAKTPENRPLRSKLIQLVKKGKIK